MKWFKHISDSLDDPFIFDLISEFGGNGYLVFFGTIEIIAREFDSNLPGTCTVSERFLTKKFQLSHQLLLKIQNFLEKRGRILFKRENGYVTINCPKMKDLCDEYTCKKLLKVSGQTPDSVGTKSPPITDKDKEEDKEDTNALPSVKRGLASATPSKESKKPEEKPPDKPSASRHFSEVMFKRLEDTNDVCAKLVQRAKDMGQPFNPYSWIQGALKGGGHTEAILKTLLVLEKTWKKIDGVSIVNSPFAYANTIMQKENYKHHERDRIRDHEALKAYIASSKIPEDIKGLCGVIGTGFG